MTDGRLPPFFRQAVWESIPDRDFADGITGIWVAVMQKGFGAATEEQVKAAIVSLAEQGIVERKLVRDSDGRPLAFLYWRCPHP